MDAPSEKTQAKAAEYLLKGRVKITYLIGNPGHETCLAEVMSASQDGDPYQIRFDPQTGWHCDCPARVPLCAHILACTTITNLTMTAAAPTFAKGETSSVEDFLKGL